MSQEYYCLNTALLPIVVSSATNLSADPHPCPYHEAWETVGYSGDGNPIELGAGWCEWNWKRMEASWWRQLFTLSGISTDAYIEDIYIRTRTNQVDSDETYQYKNFKATMYRPVGKSAPHYMFEDVTVKFTRLVGYADYGYDLFSLNPFLWWILGDTAAPAQDSSGNDYDGTCAGSGLTYSQTGIGDGFNSILFDGAAGYIITTAAGPLAAFDGEEGSAVIWIKASDATFDDSTIRRIFVVWTDANNFAVVAKTGTDHNIQMDYKAGGTSEQYQHAVGSLMTSFMGIGMTWSKSNDRVRYYIDGDLKHTDTTLGAWSGAPTRIVVGATDSVPNNLFGGNLQHFALFDTELSQANMETLTTI